MASMAGKGSSGKRKAPYTRQQRVAMAKKGWAIPITNDAGEILDGSCPVANKDDLARAIKNLSKARDKRAAKAHIRTRAQALGLVELLPSILRPPAPRRRGRPVGSVSLTRERTEKILGLIRGGVFPHVAARLAGVSERTVREWVARGEGHSSRPSTPKLRAFARKYREAQAEARALAEARIYKEDVKWWLSHAAPSRDGLLGWTTAPEGADGEKDAPSPEELKDLITGIRNDQLYSDPATLVPECLNRRCRCTFHRPRTPEELERFRVIAAKRRNRPGGER
jgi:hypothetical protein